MAHDTDKSSDLLVSPIENEVWQHWLANPKPKVQKITPETNNGSPHKQNFIERTQSIFTALYYLEQKNLINKTSALQQAYELEAAVIQQINAKWDLDKIFKDIHFEVHQSDVNNKIALEKKLRAKYLNKVFKGYLSYMHNEVLPKLLAAIPAQTHAEAMAILTDAENVCSSLKIVRNKTKDGKVILTEEAWLELDCEYNVATLSEPTASRHFSVQTPKGRVTHYQLAKMQADPKQSQWLKTNALGQTNRFINRNCYSRSGEGVAALRKNTCGYIDENNERKTTLAQYHHSSPVPYREQDDPQRLAMTIRNAQQVIEVLADEIIAKKLQTIGLNIDKADSVQQDNFARSFGTAKTALSVPLTEIRLLSPIRKEFAFLDKQQRQYQQTLEAFIAFSSCDGVPFEATICFPDSIERKIFVKPEVNFFDFGVNQFRHEIFCDPLQDWINVRGFNDLSDHVFNKLFQLSDREFMASLAPIFNSLHNNDFKALKNNMVEGRKKLKELYEELRMLLDECEMSSNQNKSQSEIAYQNKLIEITDFIERQHAKEANLLALRKKWWIANAGIIKSKISATSCAELLQDFAEAQDLYYGKQYNIAANNYCLQKTLIRLNYNIGCIPVTGCNDAKDRGGNMVNRVEADEVFYSRYQRYPRFNNPTDQAEIKAIQAIVHSSSSTLYGTKLYSVPGALGYQLYAADGNEHLDLENSLMAQLGKGIYHLPIKLRLQDGLTKFKQLFVKAQPKNKTEQLSDSKQASIYVPLMGWENTLAFRRTLQ